MRTERTPGAGGREKARTDREWDRALRVQTAGRENESGSRYMPYEPTPYAVLARLAERGGIRAGDRVLDYGCGKGRVAFFLADRVGCDVTGIDHSERLIAMAEENRGRFAHPGRVRFVRARAEDYDPGDGNAFFFFNPFSEGVLRAALRRILRGREAGARLFFYYPSEPFLRCLGAEPRLRPAGEIDCRDLFDGDNPRERILIYETVPEQTKEAVPMETRYYTVERIDGDYAWLRRTDVPGEEPLLVARALLPEDIDEGTKLKYEMLQYETIE